MFVADIADRREVLTVTFIATSAEGQCRRRAVPNNFSNCEMAIVGMVEGMRAPCGIFSFS